MNAPLEHPPSSPPGDTKARPGEERSWVEVMHVDDCAECDMCGEAWCVKCDAHYDECSCPGPMQDDLYEYKEARGVL